MLEKFKNLDLNRLALDELVTLAAFGKLLRAEYEVHQLEEPEFVDVQLKSLRREIHARNADRLEASLRDKKARLESLKTPVEKRQELRKEIAGLEKQLSNA